MNIVNVSDIVEWNGKTVRENNLAIQHNIPIGTLVEIDSKGCCEEWNGCRLYVVAHERDCDGEPLYALSSKGYDIPEGEYQVLDKSEHGFSEGMLKVVSE